MKAGFAASLLLVIVASGAHAQDTYFVDDQLTITLRSGESTSHQILRTLKSGAKMTLISTNKETGYSHAVLPDGTEGWVLTRFLTKKPIARTQLSQAQSTIERLQTELNQAQKELTELRSTHTTTSKSNNELSKKNQQITEELDQIKHTAANALALDEENKELKTELIHLETEIQSLEQQKSVLQDNSARSWFITGTGVALLGIVIGLIAPKLRVQRKSNWGEI